MGNAYRPAPQTRTTTTEKKKTLVSRSSTGFIAYDLSSDSVSVGSRLLSVRSEHRIMPGHITRPETLPTNHAVAHVRLGPLTHTYSNIRHKRYGHRRTHRHTHKHNIPFMDPSSVYSRVHRYGTRPRRRLRWLLQSRNKQLFLVRRQRISMPDDDRTASERTERRSVRAAVDIHNCVMRTDKSSHRRRSTTTTG